ncbi:COP9 signalosome catalytic subunit rri1 [Tritrichomonas musculus]|uniref:COP9 signalosome catalytic subunit rri1 n=1 Tax=Tritrichomonas musculus TaxID=1915356 RepID=A0ABR2KZT5_9EUKA
MNISEKDYFSVDFEGFVVPFRLSNTAKNDTRYFTDVYITPRALLNMMNHSLTTKKEIMGYLSGHFKDHSYLITDAVALPVEGTETRVTSDDAAFYRAIEHYEDMHRFGRQECDTGWYHSHPGLWCFFSNIDVQNHRLNQFIGRGGCYVGLVIDPLNTASSGKLHLGAYSTFREEEVDDTKPIPDDLFSKYGIMANHYYQLTIHYFKTKTDDLILKDIISRSYYQTISASPLDLNSEYSGKNSKNLSVQIERVITPQQRDDDLPQLKKIIKTSNNDRITGLKVHRMKKSIFG